MHAPVFSRWLLCPRHCRLQGAAPHCRIPHRPLPAVHTAPGALPVSVVTTPRTTPAFGFTGNKSNTPGSHVGGGQQGQWRRCSAEEKGARTSLWPSMATSDVQNRAPPTKVNCSSEVNTSSSVSCPTVQDSPGKTWGRTLLQSRMERFSGTRRVQFVCTNLPMWEVWQNKNHFLLPGHVGGVRVERLQSGGSACHEGGGSFEGSRDLALGLLTERV